jgi:hypothetical protein
MKVVFRTAKLKTFGNIGGLNAHCTRTMDVPNADAERQHLNKVFKGSDDMVADVKKHLSTHGIGLDKLRKDGVLAFEVLLSASPEFFDITGYHNGKLAANDPQKIRDWVINSNAWLKKEFGENLVTTHLHLDEQTPHFHALIVPVVAIPLEKQKAIEGMKTQTGKLNCKHFLGGREKLIKLQDRYSEAVESLGVERGLRGSKAQHITLKEYYSGITKEVNEAKQNQLNDLELESRIQQERTRAEQLRVQELEASNRLVQAQRTALEISLQNEKLTAEKQVYEELKKTPPTYTKVFDAPLPSLIPKEIIAEKPKSNLMGMISKEEHERVVDNLKEQFNKEINNMTRKAAEFMLAGVEIMKKEMAEVANWKHAFENNKRLEAMKSKQINKDKGMSL